MAASAQKKPAKRVAAGRNAGNRGTSGRSAAAKRGTSGRNGAKRATSRRTAAAKRGTSARNGAKRATSGRSVGKRATSGRRRATSATPRVRRNPAPRREIAQESEFISAFDWILSGLGGLFRAYGREIAMAALLILTLCDALTFTPAKGILVGWLSFLFRGLFGYGYLLTVPALLAAFLILWRGEGRRVGAPIACTLLLPFLFGMLGHLLLPGAAIAKDKGVAEFFRSLWESGQALISGGVLSGGVAEFCRAFFSQFAALVLLLIVLYRVSSRLEFRRRREALPEFDEDEEEYFDYSPDDEYDLPDDKPGLIGRVSDWLAGLRYGRGSAEYAEPDDSEWDDEEDIEETRAPLPERSETREKPVKLKKKSPPKLPKPEPEDEEEAPPEAPQKPEVPPVKETKERSRTRKNKESGVQKEPPTELEQVSREMSRMERTRDAGDYVSPPIALLTKNQSQSQREDRAELARNARRLEETLTSFDVNAASAGEAVRGPSITRYEFKLEQGVKLSKIMNLADDIALSLGSGGVRIAPIQNRKSVVGIEVPNSQKTPVLLRDVVESPEFLRRSSATTFALGKDISGEIVTGCIEELPHVLIAGTTGSGKSVCTNSMIISLLYKSAPEQLRLIMIDPKMVELAPYNGIPHLLIPVVTDPRKAAGALQWAVGEMMRRYKTFSENGVKKLSEYQRLTLKKKDLQPLPSVVVVIDELADLMMVAAKEVEESIMRVAQMGRAAGIHLVIATQRPSADIITGLMKANIPSRIAFAVASAMESRIILDSAGAEKLVGNGDMLYSPLGGERKRVQGCYVGPDEIEKVVAFVKGEHETRYDDDVLATIDAAVSGQERKSAPVETKPAEPEQDELLPAAVDIVLETGQASTSMLQRRLKLGYSRASRLIDQMERCGYVGPFEGSRPRQLLITKEKWQELKMRFPLPSD